MFSQGTGGGGSLCTEGQSTKVDYSVCNFVRAERRKKSEHMTPRCFLRAAHEVRSLLAWTVATQERMTAHCSLPNHQSSATVTHNSQGEEAIRNGASQLTEDILCSVSRRKRGTVASSARPGRLGFVLYRFSHCLTPPTAGSNHRGCR